MSFNSTNMFSSYNKGDNRGARIGNWVEENALEANTGSSRYGTSLKDSSNTLPTPARVIAHTEQELSKDYCTTSYRDDPAQNSEFNVPANIGPRALRRLQQQKDTAVAAEFEEKPKPDTDYMTQSRGTFGPIDPSDYPSNILPRGGGGSAIREGTAGQNADILSLTRRELAERDDAKVGSGDYTKDVPITVYSQNLGAADSTYFPSTVASGANPFGRSTHFTNDIRDPTKTHAECCDEGGLQVTSLGPNAHQRAAVDRVRAQLSGRDVLDILDQSGNMQLNKSDFRAQMSKFDVEVTDKELAVIFSYFDRKGTGWVSFNEFMLALQ